MIHCPDPVTIGDAPVAFFPGMLEGRLRYLRELDERRTAILDSISSKEKLDAALKQG